MQEKRLPRAPPGPSWRHTAASTGGPDGPGPGERWIEGVVLPAGDDPDAPGIEGATVATLEDPERSVQTRVGGAYDLIVPEEAEVSVRIDAEGFVSVVSPIQTAWQVELQAGLLHRLFGTGEFGGFFDQVLGGPWDPSLGALWVQVQGEDERPLAGASVVLSPGPELAAAFNTDGVEPGSTQGADPLFLLLGNVAPGPATIEVTDPRGGVCAGRSSFEVLPGLLTQVVHRCSLE